MTVTHGSLNGQAEPNHSRESLRQLRLNNAYTRETIKQRGLERTAKVVESFLSIEWANVYSDMLDRFRNPDLSTYRFSSVGDRRFGMNWPLVRNEQDLALLRMPSRMLCSTNDYAIGLLTGLTSYVIGAGYDYRAAAVAGREDECPKELIRYCQTVIDDTQRLNDWHGGEQPAMEAELFWRSCEDGEFFLRCFPREDGTTIFRTVECEQVTMPPGMVETKTGRRAIPYEEGMFGVITPADDAQDVRGYYVFYGVDISGGSVVDREEMVHYRRNSKRSMKRGMPDFSFDSYTRLVQASKLANSIGTCAGVQAAIPWIQQYETATKETVETLATGLDVEDFQRPNPASGRTESFQRIQPGTIPHIDKGQQYVASPAAGNATAHLAVLQMLAQAGGRRWNAPPWLATGDNPSASYATSLTEESPFIKTVTREQTSYKGAFVKPFWFALEHRIKTNGGVRLHVRDGEVLVERHFTWENVKKLIDIQVEAHSPEVRNKLENAQRQQIQIQCKTLSPQTAITEDGRDVGQEETNMLEWAEKMGQQAGPQLPPAGGPSPFGAGGGQPMPTPESRVRQDADEGEWIELPSTAIAPLIESAPVVATPLEQQPINLTLNITNPPVSNSFTMPDAAVVPAPIINVTTPDQPAPIVNVSVPPQSPPIVNVTTPAINNEVTIPEGAIKVTVEQPEARRKEIKIVKDEQTGKWKGEITTKD